MNEQRGWTFLAIGTAILALDWIALIMVAYLYGMHLGERLFQ